MNVTSQQIIQKLWHYCNLLRDDGLSYPDYVEQLTYLIFLKMAEELGGSIIPSELSWASLLDRTPAALHSHYSRILNELDKHPGMLGLIFGGSKNRIQDPAKLRRLVVELIDKEQWTSFDADVKGDAYEGLLEKTSRDSKSGAGQYFTPRPLIRAIMDVLQPCLGETICDPACGTGGFLLAAREYVLKNSTQLSATQRRHQQLSAYRGVELVQSVARLGAMNLLLHGIGPVEEDGEPPIRVGDSLLQRPTSQFDVVATNPPFGKKSSVKISRGTVDEKDSLNIARPDFWASTGNKQLNFLQHVRTVLSSRGRAAVVLPDNVLFEGGVGETIRRALLKECDVHTLLRLPTGLFYAQGVRANVLFFHRHPSSGLPGTQTMWVYDLRTNLKFSLRTRQLKQSDLDEFVKLYKPHDRLKRRATWSEASPQGRWRAYSYAELTSRTKCNLDLTWIRDATRINRDTLPNPQLLTREIARDLRAALKELESVVSNLNTDASLGAARRRKRS